MTTSFDPEQNPKRTLSSPKQTLSIQKVLLHRPVHVEDFMVKCCEDLRTKRGMNVVDYAYRRGSSAEKRGRISKLCAMSIDFQDKGILYKCGVQIDSRIQQIESRRVLHSQWSALPLARDHLGTSFLAHEAVRGTPILPRSFAIAGRGPFYASAKLQRLQSSHRSEYVTKTTRSVFLGCLL